MLAQQIYYSRHNYLTLASIYIAGLPHHKKSEMKQLCMLRVSFIVPHIYFNMSNASGTLNLSFCDVKTGTYECWSSYAS